MMQRWPCASLEAPLAEEGATSLRKRQAPEAAFRLLARPAWGADPGMIPPPGSPGFSPSLKKDLLEPPWLGPSGAKYAATKAHTM